MGRDVYPLFRVELHKAYFTQGFFNVSVDYERYFGANGETIDIGIEGDEKKIAGIINRTANKNGTPRIMGGARLKRYLATHYRQGDILTIRILAKNRIEIVEVDD